MKNVIGIKVLRLIILFCILLGLTLEKTEAQELEVIHGQDISIQSTALNEVRTFTIYLPNTYEFSEHHYPVLYLLDGRTHFQHACGAMNYLSNMDIIPPSIVVAIHNVDRNRDFSPVHDEQIPASGGAEFFLKFLDQELIPYVKENFRTSDFSILMGHSFGGTFAAYALLEEPELFDAFITPSPYLHFKGEFIIKLAEAKLRPSYEHEKYFYQTVGNEPDYFGPMNHWASLISEKSANAIHFESTVLKDENHATIPYPGVYYGLRFVFSDWELPGDVFSSGLKGVDEHYEKLKKKYGLDLGAPEQVINALGYSYLQVSNFDEAITVFKENVKRNPLSSNVYDSLGEAYEKNNQPALARKNYQKAYDLGMAQHHQNTPIYKANLERISR